MCYLISNCDFFSEVVRKIARLIALALDLDANFFEQPEILGKPIAILRLLHYGGEYLKLLKINNPIFIVFIFHRLVLKTIRKLVYVVDQVSDPTKGIYGAGAHSDYGLITLLATDGVSGLQVCKFDISHLYIYFYLFY